MVCFFIAIMRLKEDIINDTFEKFRDKIRDKICDKIFTNAVFAPLITHVFFVTFFVMTYVIYATNVDFTRFFNKADNGIRTHYHSS